MEPTVVAAWIAAGVSALTLAGTLVAQYLGHRATSRDAEKTAEEQREHLDRTLAEERTRTLNERFDSAAAQLGSDKPALVQLAGIYAMARLADDWPENRQTSVDVLCGYLRMPYAPDPGQDASRTEQLAFREIREVRHTAIRVITAHLREGSGEEPWQELNFDFTGAVFDGGDFSYAQFSVGTVNFRDAVFSGGTVDFRHAVFSGGLAGFSEAVFSGGTVDFRHAEFSSSDTAVAERAGVWFAGGVAFSTARFSGSMVDFSCARFSSGKVGFREAVFSGGTVDFRDAVFSGGTVDFSRAVFSGSEVDFRGANFSGSEILFTAAGFFHGGVDFRTPGDWSCPPAFPWADTPPPPCVKLPVHDQTEALR